MNAPTVLFALVERGVVLWDEGDRLRYRAPQGALDAEIRAAVASVRGALVALVRAGAVLPSGLAGWPEEWRGIREERAAIMEIDGRLRCDVAEREAERAVRLEHVRDWLDRAAMRSAP